MSKLKTVFRYGNYLLKAKTRYEVHSPFVFEFISEVLRDRRHYYVFEEIESLRSKLLADENEILVVDFGAGSKVNKTPNRKISAIAKNTLITPKFGQLMFRVMQHFQPTKVLEIGTSLGISTLYLAKGKNDAEIVTLEGSPAVANIADIQFQTLNTGNIEILTGEFSQTLPDALKRLSKIDLAFIDGNHRLKPTIEYFNLLKPYIHNDTILIFDDIHWSDEMHEAWTIIKNDPRVTLSIDLFFKGIVFFRSEFHVKSHAVLQF